MARPIMRPLSASARTNGAAASPRAYHFGTFRFIPERQLLLDGDQPLRLGARALEILAALVEHAGDLVTKRELFARVWPDTCVEKGNLKVHVAALRKVLARHAPEVKFVSTVNGRGYRFVAPVELRDTPPPASRAHSCSNHNLPHGGSRAVGRDAQIDAVVRGVMRSRFVTVTGPGGIGKTTVALVAAGRLIEHYDHGACFVDLGPLPDPALVPRALALALGLSILSEDVAAALAAFLHEKQMLIVLDCCEHVIDAAASLVERILDSAPGVHVLTTSREPLRARGESVYRLSPLETPPPSQELSADEALLFPAVELFVERARQAHHDFELTNTNAPMIAEICRKLDGIALAIELAATRADAFGVRHLLDLLDDRFDVMRGTRRTNVPRHQTLTAALDWSYELLPESERRILRWLSVFVGNFTLESAAEVAQCEGTCAAEVIECLANLVAKSLVAVDLSDALGRYRLLDTTRAYACRKLADSGESSIVARRHAEYHRRLFERAAREWEQRPMDEWLREYGPSIGDARRALKWAFDTAEDIPLGIELTVVMVPLWVQLSLFDECRVSVERALDRCDRDLPRDEHGLMKLWNALGAALLHTQGPCARAEQAWSTALRLAEESGDSSYRQQALWGLCNYSTWTGSHREALAIAEKIRALAKADGDEATELNVGRQIGTALRYLCDLSCARRELETVIRCDVAPSRRSQTARFHHDPRAAAAGTLANVLWLQGYPDQALEAAQRSLEDSMRANNALALCNALAHTAIPIALYVGDWSRAEQWLSAFDDHVSRHGMAIWKATAECLRGVILIRNKECAGVRMLEQALEKLRDSRFQLRYPAYLAMLASGYAAAGRPEPARAAISEALLLARKTEENWCLPELMRIEGEIIRLEGAGNSNRLAEDHFERALEQARHLQTVSWELRAASSLARLWRDAGQQTRASELVTRVCTRYGEGFESLDLRSARQSLDTFPAILC